MRKDYWVDEIYHGIIAFARFQFWPFSPKTIVFDLNHFTDKFLSLSFTLQFSIFLFFFFLLLFALLYLILHAGNLMDFHLFVFRIGSAIELFYSLFFSFKRCWLKLGIQIHLNYDFHIFYKVFEI